MGLIKPVLFGRPGSHYTRLVRIVAYEAAVDLPLAPITDLGSLDPADYGGHPGLKMPTLQDGGERVFGALEICRRVAKASPTGLSLVWPEAFPPSLRNGWELLGQAMQAQVQLALGVGLGGLPGDHPYFAKIGLGLEGVLDWLETWLPELLAQDPPADLSLFQAALFCLLDHMRFRTTLDTPPGPRLERFRQAFALRASALGTPYRPMS
jgi:glutathione S-transferase